MLSEEERQYWELVIKEIDAIREELEKLNKRLDEKEKENGEEN